MRLLFVYGFAPSGHASAAKALETRARALGHETSRIDITADYHRVLGPAINSIYLKLIQGFPNLWTTIHENESAAEILSHWRNIYHLFEGNRLRSTIEELKPDRIVCTHAGPFAALTLAKEKGELSSMLAGVVTDFHPHPYWAVPGADLYLTATPEAARTMVARGIAPELVIDTGIPIHPLYEEPLDRAAARRALALPETDSAILISGGSRGLGRLAEVVAALLPALASARLLVVCGANQELHEELRKAYPNEPRLSLFGLLEPARMKQLMAAADLFVGKAGGLTCAECLALGLPMIVLDPIPGQEERNAAYLTQAGAAVMARQPSDLPAVARPLLEPGRLAQLRERARAIGRPGAGTKAVEAIIGLSAVPGRE